MKHVNLIGEKLVKCVGNSRYQLAMSKNGTEYKVTSNDNSKEEDVLVEIKTNSYDTATMLFDCILENLEVV